MGPIQKLRALLMLQNIFNKGTEVHDMKPGYRTTEFWLTTAVSIWSMFGGMVPSPYNVAIPAIGVAVYTVARNLAKAGVIKGTVGKELVASPEAPTEIK